MLKEAIEEEKSSKEIVAELKEAVAKHNITECVSGRRALLSISFRQQPPSG